MTNMNILSPTAAKIYAAWLREGQSEPQRNYLGASVIGHECDMYLWLMFRKAVRESFDGRMYRLFDRGKREEAVFCSDLRRIGCEVVEFGPDGNQLGFSDLGGHFGGHIDGMVKGLDEAPSQWHVAEFKTHSDASFRKLCKEGVRKAKPMHYAQMQTYMGQMKIDSALYMAVDKDTDDLWCERVKFDPEEYCEIMKRALRIIDTTAPERCSKRKDNFKCKGCPCSAVCWHDAEEFIDPNLPLNCRTCCHATAVTSGEGARWKCALGHECSEKGCPSHLVIPVFVNGEIVEGDKNGMLYSYEDENGNADGITIGGIKGISEAEAKRIGPKTARAFKEIKEVFPQAKVADSNTLKVKYSSDEYETYFEGTVAELSKWCEIHPIGDFSNPIRKESFDGVDYYEYAPSTLVTISGDKAEVRYERMPF